MNNCEIIKIFENLGFCIKSDKVFGTVISMTPEDAFIFSAITGAKYLFYENGITMKGRSEVFIHRSVFSGGHLIYSPGLFSRTVDGFLAEGDSAENLQIKYPVVFEGDKKIFIYDVPEKITSNVEKDVYKQIASAGENPNEYVLYKNFLSNNVGESMQEYFASLFFINQGFIVENQVPWFQQNLKYNGKIYQGGIPDFSAFHCSMSNVLRANGIMHKNKGIAVQLLPVISLFRKDIFDQTSKMVEEVQHRLIIGEAKTSASSLPQAIKQLNKYQNVNIANELFTIIPDSKANNSYGSMYINDDYTVKYAPKNTGLYTDERINEDDRWMDIYIRMLLLGNVSFSDVINFINEQRTKVGLPIRDKYQSIHLLDAVQSVNNEEFIQFIKVRV